MLLPKFNLNMIILAPYFSFLSCENVPLNFSTSRLSGDMLFLDWETLMLSNCELVFANHYMWLMGCILFFAGIMKMLLSSESLLFLLLGIEMMMLGVIFMVLSSFSDVSLFNFFNYTMALQFLTLVVAESAVGLTLLLLLSKTFGSVKLLHLNKLKG